MQSQANQKGRQFHYTYVVLHAAAQAQQAPTAQSEAESQQGTRHHRSGRGNDPQRHPTRSLGLQAQQPLRPRIGARPVQGEKNQQPIDFGEI